MKSEVCAQARRGRKGKVRSELVRVVVRLLLVAQLVASSSTAREELQGGVDPQ